MILHRNTTLSLIQPSVSSAVTVFAEEELEKYLRQSMGIRLERTDVPTQKQVTIRLALLSHDDMLQLTHQSFGSEGFWIRVWKNTITIAAPDGMDDCHRGLLYGVYDFLERCLGN